MSVLKFGTMIGNGANGFSLMNRVMRSNYTVDNFNLDLYQRFKVGDMVKQPTSGHVGILLEEENTAAGKTGFWLVEWFMDPRGNILKKRMQTYEYTKTLVLYAVAAEA